MRMLVAIVVWLVSWFVAATVVVGALRVFLWLWDTSYDRQVVSAIALISGFIVGLILMITLGEELGDKTEAILKARARVSPDNCDCSNCAQVRRIRSSADDTARKRRELAELFRV